MKPRPVFAEPVAVRAMVADQAMDHRPKSWGVVSLDQVGALVGGDVVGHP